MHYIFEFSLPYRGMVRHTINLSRFIDRSFYPPKLTGWYIYFSLFNLSGMWASRYERSKFRIKKYVHITGEHEVSIHWLKWSFSLTSNPDNVFLLYED